MAAQVSLETDAPTEMDPEPDWSLNAEPDGLLAVAVVSRNVAEEKGWAVGDTITLENSDGRTLDVAIVGTLFDPADYACRIAGEVKGFDPERWIDRRALRRMDPVSRFAVAAALTGAFSPASLNLSSRKATAACSASRSAPEAG